MKTVKISTPNGPRRMPVPEGKMFRISKGHLEYLIHISAYPNQPQFIEWGHIPMIPRDEQQGCAEARCAFLDEAKRLRQSLDETGLPAGMLDEMLEHNPETFGAFGQIAEALKAEEEWATLARELE